MTHVIIYTTEVCPYCQYAKALLTKKGVSYQEIRVDLDPEKRIEMETKSQRRTVPQIFINDMPIGGYDDLAALSATGKLDELLNII